MPAPCSGCERLVAEAKWLREQIQSLKQTLAVAERTNQEQRRLMEAWKVGA